MIFVFSNRKILNNHWLGDGFNSNGNENIRVAKYTAQSDGKLDFYEEHDGGRLPSEQVIEELERSDMPCCIFIHGLNQCLSKNLKRCEEIEAYGVNVIIFSWPSNPNSQPLCWKIKEYKAAEQNARRSTVALERFFDKFNNHLETTGKLLNIRSLLVHSLGNYLLQCFVSSLGYQNQLGFLKNIMLHQADVDVFGHEKWVDVLAANSRVLATINETDNVLGFSDVMNPDRLGNTLGHLNSNKIQYFNFGRIEEADNRHRLWVSPITDNQSAKTLFKATFSGNKIVTGDLAFDQQFNCFHVK